jgi:hypothetical protein
MSRRHSLNPDTQAPLCGQRGRSGRRMLPATQCTTHPELVTCAKCFTLQSDAITLPELVKAKGAPKAKATQGA